MDLVQIQPAIKLGWGQTPRPGSIPNTLRLDGAVLPLAIQVAKGLQGVLICVALRSQFFEGISMLPDGDADIYSSVLPVALLFDPDSSI